MTEQLPRSEYLVLSRGQWDGSLSREDIQKAITEFYTWYDGLVKEEKIKPGHRLTYEGKTIGRQNKVLDGRTTIVILVSFRVGMPWAIRTASSRLLARMVQ